MRLAQTVDTRLQQTQRIDPRQILASEILAWNVAELEAAVERELAENPALEASENEASPVRTLEPAPGLASGAEAESQTPLALVRNREVTLHEEASRNVLGGAVVGSLDGEEEDPLERVASHLSLRDHLRGQVGQSARGEGAGGVREDILRYLIENVDDRGYLVADAGEVAERFQVVRGDVERAIKALQSMDPPGIGARDLRECLILQAEFLEQAGEGNPLARRILQICWDDLISHRTERMKPRLKAQPRDIERALAFLQRALTPYPGASFRPRGHRGNSGAPPPARPDIIFHRTEAGFLVELTRDFEHLLTVAPHWRQLAETGPTGQDDAMRRYVKEHVERAQTFMHGVERRGRTLRAIARELARHQMGFLETRNRAFLRPLTRQALAEKLKLDESVISRAVADKWAQLPSGEIIPLDAFFGNSQAIREALANLIATEDPVNPYSDDEIAEILTAQGFPLARRTVAKYRNLERILPARLRKRRAA